MNDTVVECDFPGPKGKINANPPASKATSVMFSPDLTKKQHIEILKEMSEADFARFRYCQEMAGGYLAVGRFEDMLITAMNTCNRIKLKKALGDDAERWAQFLLKREILQGSTLGSLIKILEHHSVLEEDLRYLRWIKDKRDYFIHRLFHEGAWPGDLDENDCRFMTRRLLAIQILLSRAERNIWYIFERAGLVELQRLADGGILAINPDLHDITDSEED